MLLGPQTQDDAFGDRLTGRMPVLRYALTSTLQTRLDAREARRYDRRQFE
jgi:hypothetical protein